MRPSSRTSRGLAAALAVGVVAGFGFTASAVGSVRPPRPTPVAGGSAAHTSAITSKRFANTRRAIAPTTTAPITTAPATPVVVRPAARSFATGNPRLDALLATLPSVLFEGGATVHFGYNPVDCCHAGGYNPGPNEVWVSERALSSTARLVYVTVHELGHSLHLHSARGAALTAAVVGAPVVRAGSPWDASEKVADCVAWVLFAADAAASGLTYWNCPDPWRSQVRAALA